MIFNVTFNSYIVTVILLVEEIVVHEDNIVTVILLVEEIVIYEDNHQLVTCH
jgi:hypothetical protein